MIKKLTLKEQRELEKAKKLKIIEAKQSKINVKQQTLLKYKTIDEANKKRIFTNSVIDEYTKMDEIENDEIINSIPYKLIKNSQNIFNYKTEISLLEFYYIATQMFMLTFGEYPEMNENNEVISNRTYDVTEVRRNIANLIIRYCLEEHKLDSYKELYDIARSVVASEITLNKEQQKHLDSVKVKLVKNYRDLFLPFMEIVEQDLLYNHTSKVEYSKNFLKNISDMNNALNTTYNSIKPVFKDLFDIEIDIYRSILKDYETANIIYNLLDDNDKEIKDYNIAIEFLKNCENCQTIKEMI